MLRIFSISKKLHFESRSQFSKTITLIWKRSITLRDSKKVPVPVGTMAEASKKMMDRMGLSTRYSSTPGTREHLLEYQPKLEDLPPRSLADSYTSAIIPISTDNTIHDKYISVNSRVRMGRLMEDMDMFAVWVCHQHVKLPKLPEGVPLPYTFVTILVDKISFTDYVPNDNEDIRLCGHISNIGRTSLEITVWLEQKDGDKFRKITQAVFLMAARNAPNTGSALVNPLQPADDLEKKILAESEMRKKQRTLIKQQSVFKTEPNDLEQSLIYAMFKRTTPIQTNQLNVRKLPDKCRWMEDTVATNTIASFPENRNAHNKVFGGFLMRNATEISYICAYLFAKSRPRVSHLCDISFEKPVAVSSFIRMNSYVVYSEGYYVQVMTVADVMDSMTGEQLTTNVFYNTYEAKEPVPEVMPRTYHEAMWFLEGRRKFKYAMGIE